MADYITLVVPGKPVPGSDPAHPCFVPKVRQTCTLGGYPLSGAEGLDLVANMVFPHGIPVSYCETLPQYSYLAAWIADTESYGIAFTATVPLSIFTEESYGPVISLLSPPRVQIALVIQAADSTIEASFNNFLDLAGRFSSASTMDDLDNVFRSAPMAVVEGVWSSMLPAGFEMEDLRAFATPRQVVNLLMQVMRGPVLIWSPRQQRMAAGLALLLARLAAAAYDWMGVVLPSAPTEVVTEALAKHKVSPHSANICTAGGLVSPSHVYFSSICGLGCDTLPDGLSKSVTVFDTLTGAITDGRQRSVAREFAVLEQVLALPFDTYIRDLEAQIAPELAREHVAAAWRTAAADVRLLLAPALVGCGDPDLCVRLGAQLLSTTYQNLRYLVPQGILCVSPDCGAAAVLPEAREFIWHALSDQRWFCRFLEYVAADQPPLQERARGTTTIAQTWCSETVRVSAYRIGRVHKLWERRLFVISPEQRTLSWYTASDTGDRDDEAQAGRKRGEQDLSQGTLLLAFERPRGEFPGAAAPPPECKHFAILTAGDERILTGFEDVDQRTRFLQAAFACTAGTYGSHCDEKQMKMLDDVARYDRRYAVRCLQQKFNSLTGEPPDEPEQ